MAASRFIPSAWVKFNVLSSSGRQTIISAHRTGVHHYWNLGKNDTGELVLYFNTANTQTDCEVSQVPPVPFVAGQFYHIAATKSGGTISLFVDGQEIKNQSTVCTGAIRANSGTTSIGVQGEIAPIVSAPLDGLIDEVDIFNRALTASEIQAIYNAGSVGKCRPQCTQPPSGMVVWSPGDGNANDISGNDQHGTTEGGATFSQGKVGQAFSFDGINDRVRIPDSPVLRFGTGDLTIDAWIKAPPGATVRTFLGKEDQSFQYPSIVFRLSPVGKLEFVVTDCGTGACGYSDPGGNGSRQPVQSPSRIDDDVFHHVAGVRRSTGYELYIDGQLVATRTEEARNSDNTWPLFIGIQGVATNGGMLNPFQGLVDEAGIYNRALSASEIQAIYNAGSAGKCQAGPFAYVTNNGANNVSVINTTSGTVARTITVGSSPQEVAVTPNRAEVSRTLCK